MDASGEASGDSGEGSDVGAGRRADVGAGVGSSRWASGESIEKLGIIRCERMYMNEFNGVQDEVWIKLRFELSDYIEKQMLIRRQDFIRHEVAEHVYTGTLWTSYLQIKTPMCLELRRLTT